MNDVRPRCTGYDRWFDSLTDEAQCEILKRLRAIAEDLQVDIQYRQLSTIDEQSLITQNSLDILTHGGAMFALN